MFALQNGSLGGVLVREDHVESLICANMIAINRLRYSGP